ncbi:MAG: sugar phosphate isomerase/epimerase [Rhodobacteraceae bacterium]|nr:sugar phosphate isomerase/epimerase [Paracoccaceae bacterium]
MKTNRLIYNSIVSRHATLAIDLEIVREAGFDGYEVAAGKLRDFLAAGFSEAELVARLAGTFVSGIGYLADIERAGEGEGEAALLGEARDLFRLARIAGARAVQILTGPLRLRAVEEFAATGTTALYRGVLGLPRDRQLTATARAMARLADLAADEGLLLYLESLAWTPLNRLADQVELIRRAGRGNLRLVVDFWHCHAAGDSPDALARLDGRLIWGVHVCDSLPFAGGIPDEVVLRDVPAGRGVLRLRDWADAVKATGYTGWWSCESFCRRQHQDNSFAVARELRDQMRDLVGV